MSPWLTVVILGIIEGLTEFIPVSSTGHLLAAEQWLGQQTDLFNVVIQCGAVLAVLPLFKKRIIMLSHWHNAESRDFNFKILTAFFITGVGGLVINKLGFKLPENIQPVAIALILGGIIFIVVESLLKKKTLSTNVTWLVVIAVAAGQLIAAVFPGASRSGSTIMLAMLCGLARGPATEFSFLVGIPTMLAAGALEIHKGLKEAHVHGVHENWHLVLLATVVAAIVSFFAVKWLLRYVQSHTFINFGIYRIVLGVALLWVLWPKG